MQVWATTTRFRRDYGAHIALRVSLASNRTLTSSRSFGSKRTRLASTRSQLLARGSRDRVAQPTSVFMTIYV
jgi:hypothetical protein